MADTVLIHPNRDKPESKATKASVIFLLLVSAALVLIITLGGWSELQGAQVVSFAYVVVVVAMAFFVSRWNRGVLPVAAAIAILFTVVAAGAGLVRARQGGIRRSRARAIDPRPPDADPRPRAAVPDRLRNARLPAAVERGGRGHARRRRALPHTRRGR